MPAVSVRNPNYEMVHEGYTGHAEVVMVQYDPEVISYEDLLKVFWQCHDPTTPNRQGPDVGTQYRSIILYHNEAQRKAALKSYHQLVEARAFRNPIVTQLVPLKAFYRAEDEHQDYYGGKPRASSRRKEYKLAPDPRNRFPKVAKVLATDLADETKPSEEAKPAEEKPATTGSASEKAGKENLDLARERFYGLLRTCFSTSRTRFLKPSLFLCKVARSGSSLSKSALYAQLVPPLHAGLVEQLDGELRAL